MDVPSSSRRRRTLLRLGILVLLTLVLGEVGLRVYAHAIGRPRGVTLHPELGWHMLPNVAKRGGEWGPELAHTNAHGWLDADHDHARTPGQRRVVALGDSFTFGHEVRYGERFTEYLEELVPDTEVVNLGACGFGPDQEWITYRLEGRRYDPDVVLWTVYLGNDLTDLRLARASGWAKPRVRLVEGELVVTPPEHDLSARVRSRSYLAEVVIQAFWPRPAGVRADDHEEVDSVKLLRAIAAQLQADVQADGGQLVVVLVHECGKDRHPRTARVRQLLERDGLQVIDSYPWLGGSGRPLEDLYATHGHWSPGGHRAVAEALAPTLEGLLEKILEPR